MGDEAPPEGNDEGMTHNALSIARPDPVVSAIGRMLDRLIDRWLRWQDERVARRREHWKRNMHRDQWLGIW
jgi:hypothetical protein